MAAEDRYLGAFHGKVQPTIQLWVRQQKLVITSSKGAEKE